jgi:hypothetical protein
MLKKTRSEEIFEKFCEARSIRCEKIRGANQAIPDYDVTLYCGHIIVEIKQLDENPGDLVVRQEIDLTGASQHPLEGIDLSERLWQNVWDSYRQLSAYRQKGMITGLVLYNNGPFWRNIEDYNVTTALMGLYGVHFTVDPSGGPACDLGGRFKGLEKTTNNAPVIPSFVAVLKEESCNNFSFRIHHNPFAAIPVPPADLLQFEGVQFVNNNPKNPHRGCFERWG